MNLRYIASFAWFTGVREIKGSYTYVIASLSFPLSLLFVVGVLSRGSMLPYALAGGLIAMVASNGIMVAGDVALFKLEFMYQDLIIATQTSRMDYMLGEVASLMFFSLPAIILFIVLDAFYHLLTPYILVVALIAAAMVLIATSSIAFVIASFLRHVRHVWAITAILSTLMIVVPPTFYPYTFLPKYAMLALSFLPTTPAAVFMQGVFGLEPMYWPALLFLIVDTLVYFLAARYFTRWRDK